jgi:hypothetical protein
MTQSMKSDGVNHGFSAEMLVQGDRHSITIESTAAHCSSANESAHGQGSHSTSSAVMVNTLSIGNIPHHCLQC